MRIFIADDHALFRQGMAQYVQELDARIDTAEVSDHVGALAEIENDPNIELILFDLNKGGKKCYRCR